MSYKMKNAGKSRRFSKTYQQLFQSTYNKYTTMYSLAEFNEIIKFINITTTEKTKLTF